MHITFFEYYLNLCKVTSGQEDGQPLKEFRQREHLTWHLFNKVLNR